jgi:hypothetical protein
MTFPLIEVGSTAAVLLGLYAFFCYWEAARADLADGFHRPRAPIHAPEAPTYRARARFALVGCGAIALALLASAF